MKRKMDVSIRKFHFSEKKKNECVQAKWYHEVVILGTAI